MTETPAVRVLLVDDEEPVRTGIGRFLGRMGFVVSMANSGREALEKLASESFDIIITDHRMPHMTGSELVGHMLERDPTLRGRIFVASGDPDAPALLRLRDQTGARLLAKPFNLAETALQLRSTAVAHQSNLTSTEER